MIWQIISCAIIIAIFVWFVVTVLRRAKREKEARLLIENILDNIKDLDPKFSKTVDENFWDII